MRNDAYNLFWASIYPYMSWSEKICLFYDNKVINLCQWQVIIITHKIPELLSNKLWFYHCFLVIIMLTNIQKKKNEEEELKQKIEIIQSPVGNSLLFLILYLVHNSVAWAVKWLEERRFNHIVFLGFWEDKTTS